MAGDSPAWRSKYGPRNRVPVAQAAERSEREHAECSCLLVLQAFFTSRKADSAFSWWLCVYQVGAYFSRSSYSSASASVARSNCSFISSTRFGCRGKLIASDRPVRAGVTFSLPPDGSSDTSKTLGSPN